MKITVAANNGCCGRPGDGYMENRESETKKFDNISVSFDPKFWTTCNGLCVCVCGRKVSGLGYCIIRTVLYNIISLLFNNYIFKYGAHILLYSDLYAKWIYYYYTEICEKILYNICLRLWYTAIARVFGLLFIILFILYVCVCVCEIRDLHGLAGYDKTSFAEVPSMDWDMIAYFLSIDQFYYCLHFVSVSSVKWYWV